jgi:hypothetical protein
MNRDQGNTLPKKVKGNVGNLWFFRIKLIFIPKILAFLGILTLLASLTRSSLFADDFTNIVKFNGGLGPLSQSDGKVVMNLFWFLGTAYFGNGSPLPFLVMNLVLFGLAMHILQKSFGYRGWNPDSIFWVFAGLFSLGVIFPILLWSSNVVHTAAIFFLAFGIYLQSKFLKVEKRENLTHFIVHSIAMGIVWMLCTLTNPLYFGVVFIAAFFSLEIVREIKLGQIVNSNFILSQVYALNLIPAILGFVFIAYPRVTSQGSYDSSGPRFIVANVKFYLDNLLVNKLLTWVLPLAALLVFIVVMYEVIKLNYFPLALILSTLGVIYPILIQGQQRAIHYFSVPLLLIIISLVASTEIRKLTSSNRILNSISIFSLVCLIFVMTYAGGSVRSWFITNPYGYSLEKTRVEIGQKNLAGKSVCVRLEMDMQERSRFIASMGGSNGFLIPPINALSIEFTEGDMCINRSEEIISISTDTLGNFKVFSVD